MPHGPSFAHNALTQISVRTLRVSPNVLALRSLSASVTLSHKRTAGREAAEQRGVRFGPTGGSHSLPTGAVQARHAGAGMQAGV